MAVKENDPNYILSFNEIVFLATLGGADVVGMGDRIENFTPGKRFDALLIDGKDVISANSSFWSSGLKG